MVDKDGVFPPPPPEKSSNGCINGGSVNQDDKEEPLAVAAPPPATPMALWQPRRRSSSSSLKPFLDGGLAELMNYSFGCSSLFLLSILDQDSHYLKQAYPNWTYAKLLKTIPSGALILIPSSTLRFGMYENLTREVETHNKGSPISLYQQVCCGLTTGAIVACIETPIVLVCARQRLEATFKDIYQNLYSTARRQGILSLWRDGSLVAHATIARNTGMLVSYDRSYNYFRGSLGSTEDNSILGAGAVSSFFAVACYQPFVYVGDLKNLLNLKYPGRYQQISSLDIALKVLKRRGPLEFFRGFHNHFYRFSLPIMWSWYSLELMRKLEYLEKSG